MAFSTMMSNERDKKTAAQKEASKEEPPKEERGYLGAPLLDGLRKSVEGR